MKINLFRCQNGDWMTRVGGRDVYVCRVGFYRVFYPTSDGAPDYSDLGKHGLYWGWSKLVLSVRTKNPKQKGYMRVDFPSTPFKCPRLRFSVKGSSQASYYLGCSLAMGLSIQFGDISSLWVKIDSHV